MFDSTLYYRIYLERMRRQKWVENTNNEIEYACFIQNIS